MTYIQKNCIDFNSNCDPGFYSGYVDDIFAVFTNSDKSDEFLNHFNFVSVPLKFTIEKRTDDKLSYIVLTISKDLFVSIIDKAPLYNFYSFSSHVPGQYLYAAINCLTHRAFMYTDKYIYLKNELNKIENSALKVGLNKSKVNKKYVKIN